MPAPVSRTSKRTVEAFRSDTSASAVIVTDPLRVNRKVLPLPGSLSTQTLPPWSSTSFRVSARPSPVPW